MTTPESQLNLNLPQEESKDKFQEVFDKALNEKPTSKFKISPDIDLDSKLRVEKVGIKIHMDF